jgi:hypothetical protein
MSDEPKHIVVIQAEVTPTMAAFVEQCTPPGEHPGDVYRLALNIGLGTLISEATETQLIELKNDVISRSKNYMRVIADRNVTRPPVQAAGPVVVRRSLSTGSRVHMKADEQPTHLPDVK